MFPPQVRLVVSALGVPSILLPALQRAVAKKGAGQKLGKVMIGRLSLVDVTPRLRLRSASLAPEHSDR